MTLLVMLTGLLFQWFLPWWSGTIAAGLVTLFFADRSWHSVLAGFLGIGLLWIVAALWMQSGNDGILAGRMAVMMGFSSGTMVFLITFVIGAVTGGLGGLTGLMLRFSLFRNT